MTPVKQFDKELAAISKQRSLLDKREEAAAEALRVAQETCKHKKWKDSGGGSLGYTFCVNCGLTDL